MKSSGGGYGLYYATVMQTTGVVRLADRSLGLPADAVTPELGANVANAYRDAIAATQYWKRYFDKDDVPADVVKELADVGCLCRLRDEAPDRVPLVDVILHGGHAPEARARRLSLQMMLELSHQTRSIGLYQDDYRRLVLYQTTYDPESDQELATFDPPVTLQSVARRWRLSQLREMFNWSLNGMWRWVCNWGLGQDGDVFPVPLDDLRKASDSVALKDLPGVRVKPSDPIRKLIDECHDAASMTDSLDGRWELWTPITEDQLFNWIGSSELSTEGSLAGLFMMYVMCLTRLWSHELRMSLPEEDWRPVLEGGPLRIGMQFALDQLRRDERAGLSVREVLWRVLTDQVMLQHERVALAKLPEDTFRFRRETDRLRFFVQANDFRRNDSRFEALSTMCAELGWSGYLAEESHGLTSEGQVIRKEGDLPLGSA